MPPKYRVQGAATLAPSGAVVPGRVHLQTPTHSIAQWTAWALSLALGQLELVDQESQPHHIAEIWKNGRRIY